MSPASHPAILVEIERQLRLPLVHGRRFALADGALVTSLPWASKLVVGVDGEMVLHERSEGCPLRIGDQFVAATGGAWRLDAANELIVDARRVGAFIAFNCFVDIPARRLWRGFAIGDESRTLIDIAQSSSGAVVAGPSTSGIPLEAIVSTTIEQRAWLEQGIARNLIMPLLAAELDEEVVTCDDVIVTWEGALQVMGGRDPAWYDDWQQLDYAISQAMYLTGQESYDDDELYGVGETHEILRAEPASPERVAALLRDLFPHAWDVERSLREQVMLLDIDSLT